MTPFVVFAPSITRAELTPPELPGPAPDRGAAPAAARHRSLACILGLWLVLYVAALFSPPLFDDADATHAQAALGMAQSGDWVTLHVDGIRYLEKPPLPYWLTAVSLRLFGRNTFAVHLPLALTVLGLGLLAYAWGKRAFNERTAFYAGLFTLTSAGVFLFTRIFIPDALFSLLLAFTLYTSLRALDPLTPHSRRYAWTSAAALAAAVLTKGLVAPVFYLGTMALFLPLSGHARSWRRLHPLSSCVLFLVLASPWHILAGLRNTAGAAGHGFFWFYFVNEHVLRFLGRRIPRDYNRLPALLYWTLHVVWLFPWSLFLPMGLILAWRQLRTLGQPSRNTSQTKLTTASSPLRMAKLSERSLHGQITPLQPTPPPHLSPLGFRQSTTLLLILFTAIVLVFFSLSTNQEYYTFPVYLPVLLLLAASFTTAEEPFADPLLRRSLLVSHLVLVILGALIATALGYGLWSSRHLAFNPDIGTLLAHRGVGDYTLSMSHFFDLTTASFAALRLPALLAAMAFAVGPALAWRLRLLRRDYASTLTLALLSAVFLIAAHLALGRFAPMLSSAAFAERIAGIEHSSTNTAPGVLLYGDQAFGSSIPFYLDHTVRLVDGRSTSLLFGSTFPDAPPIFVTPQELLASWGSGARKLLFVPLERRTDVDHLLGPRQVLVMESSGKALITDRPLPPSPPTPFPVR